MRQSSSGSLTTILMLIPLVVVPLLAMFGLPSFSPSSDAQTSPNLEINNLLGVSSPEQLGGAAESIELEPTGLTNPAVQGLPALQNQQFGHSRNHSGQAHQQNGQAVGTNQNQAHGLNPGVGGTPQLGSTSLNSQPLNSQPLNSQPLNSQHPNSQSVQAQTQLGSASQGQGGLQQNGAFQNPALQGMGTAPQNNRLLSNTPSGGGVNNGVANNNPQNSVNTNTNALASNTLGATAQPARQPEQNLQNLFLDQPAEQSNPAPQSETLSQNSSPTAFDPSTDSSLENNPFSALAAREAASSPTSGTKDLNAGFGTDGFSNGSAIQKISGVETPNNGATNSNAANTGVGGGVPSQQSPFGQSATIQPAVGEATQQPTTWQSAVQQLNHWGINKFVLQPGAKAGEFHFSCFYTPAGNSKITLRFEAESSEPLKAVENVLQQVKKWQQQQATQKQ